MKAPLIVYRGPVPVYGLFKYPLVITAEESTYEFIVSSQSISHVALVGSSTAFKP